MFQQHCTAIIKNDGGCDGNNMIAELYMIYFKQLPYFILSAVNEQLY